MDIFMKFEPWKIFTAWFMSNDTSIHSASKMNLGEEQQAISWKCLLNTKEGGKKGNENSQATKKLF